MLNPSELQTQTRLSIPAPAATRLRVAIVSDAAPERNGVGAYYCDLADHLRTAGSRVDLIAPSYRGGIWSGGIRLPLPGDPTQRILLPLPWLIHQRLARLKPDVVVVPTPGPYGMLGMHAARARGVRLVVGFHTHFEALTRLFQDWGIGGRIANGYLSTCHRTLFAQSDLVLANSPEMMEIARSLGARAVDLMATPIPRPFLEQPPTPARPTLQRVLFAGRLAPEKNLEAIVEAARRLPEIQFGIVGDGPLRDWVEDCSRQLPNLWHSGWVERVRVMDLIDETDALLLPSKIESFGTVALEAMARCRPVLVSSACGILSWDLLSRALFSIRDGEPLADALVRLRNLDPAIRERKASLGRAAAEEVDRRNLAHWLAVLSGDTTETTHAER
jgi:glycosyltransferase involved in cell wall biosynthesis